MHSINDTQITFIVISVVLFMLLGIAILVIVDHKAKIPGSFKHDPFSISGIRREHPVISFLTTLILGTIILSLLFELSVAMGERFGLFVDEEASKPELLHTLRLERFTEKKRHFHNEPHIDLVNMGKKNVCFYCHGDYPHS